MAQTASSSPPLISSVKLNGLLSELRELGQIPIGIGEEVALTRLLTELIAHDALSSLEDVRGYLAPVLTRSEADRQVFDQAFSRWFGLAPPVQPVLGVPKNASEQNKQAASFSYKSLLLNWIDRAWPWALVAFVLFYAAITVRPADLESEPLSPPVERVCTDATPQFCEQAPRTDEGGPIDARPVKSRSTTDRIELVLNGSFGYCRRSGVGSGEDNPEFYSAFVGAPTLEELTYITDDFGASNLENIGSYCYNIARTDNTDSWYLANSIGLVSGLPVNRPLPVAYDPTITARIARAIGVLSNDPNLAPLSEYVAESERLILALLAPDQAGFEFDPLNAENTMRSATRMVNASMGAERLFQQRAMELRAKALGQPYPESNAHYVDNPIWRRGGTLYRESSLIDAFWFKSIRPLFLAVFAVLLAAWMANGLDRRKAFLRRRRPLYPPSIHNFVTSVARTTPFSSNTLRRTIQSLQQWKSRQSDRLDIDKTLDRTLKQGVFTPVRAEVKGLPEYLVLIETRGIGDQETQRLRSLVRRFEDAHILVSIYYYEGNPYWCRAEKGELKDGANPFAGPIFTIEELKMRYPEHRLIVLGEGETFVDPVTEIASPGARALMNWDERAMLTPIALRSWGTREFTIAQALKLPLGRATESGASALPALLGLDGRDRPPLYSESGDGFARSVPLLIETRAARWLGDAPITEADWARLDEALRNYLNPIGYVWLSACAVYPELRWDLTLYLGQNVDIGSNQVLFDEAQLADILKLPWLRSGRMPDWFRARLIEGLAPQTAQQIRTLLRKLIDDATEGGDVSNDDAMQLRIATVEPGNEAPLQDTVFLDFLVGGQATDFELDRLEDKETRTTNRGRRGADQVSAMLWKAGLLWGAILVGTLPFGGQLGWFDQINPVDMIYDSNTWGRMLILAFATLGAAGLSLFIIDPSSVTYRRWHTFSSSTMFALAGTAMVLTLILIIDGPLWLITEPTVDFIEDINGDFPPWLDWFVNDGGWAFMLAALYAGALHFLFYWLGARLGVLPTARDVPLRRRIVSSLLSIPLVLAFGLGIGFVVIGSAVGLSGSGVGRLNDSVWEWGTMAYWPILVLMVSLWGIVLRGLIGLSRRWRRLAFQPPPPINRRGHRLMTSSIIARAAGFYAACAALFAIPEVGEIFAGGLITDLLADGFLATLFPNADSGFLELIALLIAFGIFLLPGIFYAWILDRRQSPDVGINFAFRGRGKAIMVAFGRVLIAVFLGVGVILPAILYAESAFGNDPASFIIGAALVSLIVAELAARSFAQAARRHRQNQPKRVRPPEAFGPPWLKWSGVGLVSASVMGAWFAILAAIPAQQRFGPAGPTSVELNRGDGLVLADETGRIKLWRNPNFGFADTLQVDAALDGVLDPIVRVSVDSNTGFEGCVAWRRQSGIWQIHSPNRALERLDMVTGFEGTSHIVSMGETLILTQQIEQAFATRAEPEQSRRRPTSSPTEQHIARFISCESGEDLAEPVTLRAGIPTTIAANQDYAQRANLDQEVGYVGFSDGTVQTLMNGYSEYPQRMSLSLRTQETATPNEPVVGFFQAGMPIQIPAIGGGDVTVEQGAYDPSAVQQALDVRRREILAIENVIEELEDNAARESSSGRGAEAARQQEIIAMQRDEINTLQEEIDAMLSNPDIQALGLDTPPSTVIDQLAEEAAETLEEDVEAFTRKRLPEASEPAASK